MLTALIMCGLAYAFMETTKPSQAWLLAFSILFLYSGFWTIRLAINRASFLWRLEAELRENRMEEFHLLLAPFAFVGIFAILAREMYAYAPSLFDVTQVPGPGPDSNAWLAFALDQVARAIMLDLFETYKIRVAALDYTPHFLISTVVFAFKTTLAVVFWRFIFLFFELWPFGNKAVKD
jgi:hypothetical protein